MFVLTSFNGKLCVFSHQPNIAQRSVKFSNVKNRQVGSIQKSVCRAVAESEAESCGGLGLMFRAADVMTSGDLYCCTVDTPVEEALELLVQKRVTGLPVVDNEKKVVGVVSDFDLLALDALVNEETSPSTMFPPNEQDWQAFKDLKILVSKRQGQVVGDVMTEDPLTIYPDMCIEEVTRLILTRKMRRLPVVDEESKLLGIITRGNIIKAALKARQEAEMALQ